MIEDSIFVRSAKVFIRGKLFIFIKGKVLSSHFFIKWKTFFSVSLISSSSSSSSFLARRKTEKKS
jgi:hypothetical protein